MNIALNTVHPPIHRSSIIDFRRRLARRRFYEMARSRLADADAVCFGLAEATSERQERRLPPDPK